MIQIKHVMTAFHPKLTLESIRSKGWRVTIIYQRLIHQSPYIDPCRYRADLEATVRSSIRHADRAGERSTSQT